MENTFFTLHQFLLHTESFTYILLACALVGITVFWMFLTGREDD